jgi:hypothetical protein
MLSGISSKLLVNLRLQALQLIRQSSQLCAIHLKTSLKRVTNLMINA